MKKNSTVATNRNEIFKEPKLTIGLDLACLIHEGLDFSWGDSSSREIAR